VGEMRNAYTVLVGKLTERDYLKDLSVDVNVILKWVLGT
jgi:hypothetical protein